MGVYQSRKKFKINFGVMTEEEKILIFITIAKQNKKIIFELWCNRKEWEKALLNFVILEKKVRYDNIPNFGMLFGMVTDKQRIVCGLWHTDK